MSLQQQDSLNPRDVYRVYIGFIKKKNSADFDPLGI